jgi:hypothetical protein
VTRGGKLRASSSKETVRLRPRFIAEADSGLRGRIRRYGELAQLMVLILTSVDLTTIPILELTSDIRNIAQTTVELPSALYRRLKEIAAARGTSMNAIVNSAVVEYTKRNE